MVDIQLRKVNPSYLYFLRSFDEHVPTKAGRPWLWPVRINGIDYGIPLTSQMSNAGYLGLLRCGSAPDYGLNLRYMVPVPSGALQPAEPLSAVEKMELRYFESIRKYVEAEAQLLHRLAGENQLDRYWKQHSCDFQELESVYFNWTPGLQAGLILRSQEEGQKVPISKKGKLYYTEEQYKKAASYMNALEYARSRGYELIQEKNYYKLKMHDSLVFYPDGHFYWNSRGIGNGSVLDFMIHCENMSVPEAVLTLAGDEDLNRTPSWQPIPISAQIAAQSPSSKPAEPTELKMPTRSENYRALFAYLCGVRGLDKRVVQEMIYQKRVYQSDVKLPNGKTLSNVVFVYRDDSGNVVGAFKRGTADQKGQPPYKRDAAGSDKQYGWLLAAPVVPATTVKVFEAAIDAASDASLEAMIKGDAWKEEPVDRLSMEGVSAKGLWIEPLRNYLQTHPDVRDVVLMYDADETGRAATKATIEWIRSEGWNVEVRDDAPPFGNDWNEVLTETRMMEAEAQEIQQTEMYAISSPSM